VGLVLHDLKNANGSRASSTKTWVDDEVADCDFRDTRLASANGLVLMLHDTTELTFKRDKPELIGFTETVNKKRKAGWLTPHTLCGIL
jgi:hypothetical protein